MKEKKFFLLYFILYNYFLNETASIEWFGQKTTLTILTGRKQRALSCLTTGWKCLMLVIYVTNGKNVYEVNLEKPDGVL